MIDNPYRNYDKGMDDSYMGIEPMMPQSQQYMGGYEYSERLMIEEQEEADNQIKQNPFGG